MKSLLFLAAQAAALAPTLRLNAEHPKLRFVSREPAVVVLEDFISEEACDGLVAAGRATTLEKSPVA